MAFKRGFTGPVPEARERGFAERGIATFRGGARFVDRETLAGGAHRLHVRRVVIAAGAKPRPLGFPGEELVTTSDDFLELERLLRRILFIGGGYIGFEFARIAARADVEVTVLTRGERPLKAFDPDLVDMLVKRTRDAGVALHLGAAVEAVEKGDNGLRVRALINDEPRAFEADLVVHGAGRVPALDGLDPDAGGVRTVGGGVEVNGYLQSTSNPAVYAAGDAAATAGPPLTPVASLEGRVVAANLLGGNRETPDHTGVPSVVFTVPALARDVRVVRPDLRGHGASGVPADAPTIERLVQDVVEICAHLGCTRVHLAGSSAGAMIAMRAAVDHPERVASLGLFAAIAGMKGAAVDFDA